MPSYTESWDETKPAGSRDLSLGDDDIREFKRAFRERFATDHYAAADESGNANIGYHKKATLVDQAGDPSVVAGAGILYAKTVGSSIELCYIDEDGQITQLTSGGQLNAGELPDYTRSKTGDWMLSSVTTARTGWTNVSATYADKFMRINATPLTTGGADTHTHGAGSYVAASHDHSLSTAAIDFGGGGPVDDLDLLSSTTGSSGSLAVSGTSGSTSNVPAYVQVVVFQKD